MSERTGFGPKTPQIAAIAAVSKSSPQAYNPMLYSEINRGISCVSWWSRMIPN